MINVLLQLAQTTEICQIHVSMDAMKVVTVIQRSDDKHVRVLRDFVLSVFAKASLCWLKLLFISKPADFADRISC